ncbi:GNAT family N-acetyltransferase [Acidaminobacter hydrogenoformans]|uniref:Ribosomal protein S18 acetylase RimI n=1 Tax=Acidaminobacter hydrogenoformans DSM 2784 TaxID=1120920 RepID=A0A1G5RW54_9FIRM|nr:GNAT family N-acetyltransferase [Acidaminobacter hydrogenoformans]SCZ78147.1 Ribosomal protein S18 acetylase RimI [Acidaminobacter hydrogenoformans DSM 2784]
MTVNIRPVTLQDLEAVAEVESACFPEAEAASKTSFEQRIKTFPDSFFVAELEGKVIGFINGSVINGKVIYDDLFHDTKLHIPEGKYQTIFGLDVIPAYRKKGVGEMLMAHMIETARNAGRYGLVLTCKEHLIHYYEKFGFVNLGISGSTHGGATWYDMILEFDNINL